MNFSEEFDKLKTKVLKYVLYKKRTEQEVRQKFAQDSGEMLDEVISFLKDEKYIDDKIYIEKAVNEYKNLKNLSIKELKYKLMAKGINSNILDEYICNNKEDLLQYEMNSIQNIFNKKIRTEEKDKIVNDLLKKGYMKESIYIVLEEIG